MTTTNEARIENSTICNYKCSFCPYSSNEFIRKKEIMSFELFKTIVDKIKIEAPQIEVITLSGMGEPFADKGVFNKINYLKSLNYRVNILSNASLLTEEYIDRLIETNIDTIRISFHTANIDTYQKITGGKKKDQQTALHAIGYIWRNKSDKTRLIVTADIIDNVEDEVKKLREVLEGEVDLLEIWKPHNWADWGSYRDGEKIKQTCGRPLNGPLQVQVDGTVNMCCFDYNGELKIGDFTSQTLEEIYSSDMYNEILAFHMDGEVVDHLICNQCDQLKDVGSIVYYNNKFTEEDRVGKLSTSYKEV